MKQHERVVGIEPWAANGHSGITGIIQDGRTGEYRAVTVYTQELTEAEALAHMAVLVVWPCLAAAIRRADKETE